MSQEQGSGQESFGGFAAFQKAMSEAAEADYGDAFNLANAAYDYADQAVQRCEQAQARPPSAKEPTE